MQWSIFAHVVIVTLLSSFSTCQSSTSSGLGSLILQGLGSLQTSTSTISNNSTSARFSNTTQSTTTTSGALQTSSGTNGTTASITAGPKLINYTTQVTPAGSLIVANTTFATLCPYSDLGCWETCTALGQQCQSQWVAWEGLLQTCTDGTTIALATSADTWTYTYTTYPDAKILVTTEITAESAFTKTWSGVVELVDSACSNTEDVTYLATSNGYTFTLQSPVCGYTDGTTTVTIPATTETEAWTATYALNDGIPAATSTLSITSTSYTTICSYEVPPPSCPNNFVPASGACKRGPNCNDCTIHGGTVQLLYFPPATTAISNASTPVTLAVNGSVTAAPSFIVYEGTTLTSPSVYISFQTAYAINDCNTTIGKAYTGSIIGLNPTDLSSALGNWHARQTDTAALAQGKTAVSLYAEPFNLANLQWPYPPWVWNQQARCNNFIAPICPVIISGEYNPVLAVPTQIRSFDPAWSTCALDLEGLYDPPKALQPVAASAEATPTANSAGKSSTTPAVAASTAIGPIAVSTSKAAVSSTVVVSQIPDSTGSALQSQKSSTIVVVISGTTQQAASVDPSASTSKAVLTSTIPTGQTSVSNALGALTASTQQSLGAAVVGTSSKQQSSSGDPGASVSRTPGSSGDTIAPVATLGSGSAAVTLVPIGTGSSAQVVAQSSVGSTTLQAGAVTTIAGQAISVGSNGNVVGAVTSTIIIGSDPAAGQNSGTARSPATTINGQAVSRISNGAVIGGTTLTAGSDPKTIGGAIYSVNTAGQLIIAGSSTFGAPHTTSLPGQLFSALDFVAGVSKTTVVANGQTYTALQMPGGSAAVVSGTTLYRGSSAMVVGGQTVSLGSSGLVVISGQATSSGVSADTNKASSASRGSPTTPLSPSSPGTGAASPASSTSRSAGQMNMVPGVLGTWVLVLASCCTLLVL